MENQNRFWTVYLPDSERDKFEKILKRSKLSKSALVREALHLWEKERKRRWKLRAAARKRKQARG